MLRVLHLGCGTSSLGPLLQTSLQTHFDASSASSPPVSTKSSSPISPTASSSLSTSPRITTSALRAVPTGVTIEVSDADYVESSLLPPRPIPLFQLDILDSKSVLRSVEEQTGGLGWDIIVDKSTADAISCGPRLSSQAALYPFDIAVPSGVEEPESTPQTASDGDDDTVHPCDLLCINLARITPLGARWICISYSSNRFANLRSLSSTGPWKLISRIPLNTTSMPEGRQVDDGHGGLRTVYEPETSIWAYVLERVLSS